MNRARIAILPILILVACQGSAPAATSPSPAATGSASAEPLDHRRPHPPDRRRVVCRERRWQRSTAGARGGRLLLRRSDLARPQPASWPCRVHRRHGIGPRWDAGARRIGVRAAARGPTRRSTSSPRRGRPTARGSRSRAGMSPIRHARASTPRAWTAPTFGASRHPRPPARQRSRLFAGRHAARVLSRGTGGARLPDRHRRITVGRQRRRDRCARAGHRRRPPLVDGALVAGRVDDRFHRGAPAADRRDLDHQPGWLQPHEGLRGSRGQVRSSPGLVARREQDHVLPPPHQRQLSARRTTRSTSSTPTAPG